MGAGGFHWWSYRAARAYARGLHCASVEAWRRLCADGRKPATIPRNVPQVYRRLTGRPVTWVDFLGLPVRQYRPYAAAREFARSLGLSSQLEWKDYCAGRRPGLPPKPADIPSGASESYARDGWVSWGDFLGTNNLAHGYHRYRSYAAAEAFVRELGLRTVADWRRYRRRGQPPCPADIPYSPDQYYAGRGWKSWPVFLGKRRA